MIHNMILANVVYQHSFLTYFVFLLAVVSCSWSGSGDVWDYLERFWLIKSCYLSPSISLYNYPDQASRVIPASLHITIFLHGSHRRAGLIMVHTFWKKREWLDGGLWSGRLSFGISLVNHLMEQNNRVLEVKLPIMFSIEK